MRPSAIIRRTLSVGFIVLALAHGLTRSGVGWIWSIERKWDDLLVRAPSFVPSWYKIPPLHSKVVAIDGKTLIQYGFPLKRKDYADLVDTLHAAHSGPVALDVIFGASQDHEGSVALARSIAHSKNVTLSAIVSTAWSPEKEAWGSLVTHSTLAPEHPNSEIMLDGPWPPVADSARELALTDSGTDDDGNIRWYELVHPGPEGDLPSLALAQYLSTRGQSATVERDKNGWISAIALSGGENPVQRISLWDDPQGRGRIPLLPIAKSGMLPDISFSEVLSGDESFKKSLNGAPVFVGTTLDGARPTQPTPLDPLQAAIHNHQAAFESLWTGNILHRGWLARLLEIFLGIGAVVLYSGIVHLDVLKQTLAERIYFVFSLAFKIVCFKLGIWTHITPAILTIGTLRSASVMDEYDRSEKQRRFLKQAFSNYLSPALVEELVTHPEKVSLGGEEKKLTVMFCDLRGFTAMSEGLSPSLVMKMMNQYFELVSGLVLRFEGTVDKYIGDAVMAFWGAPVAVENAETKAAQCARAITEGVRDLALQWEEELRRSVQVRVGVGLHSGVAIVGNVGGKARFNYTAMGDSVNLASRIEGLTKVYGVNLLLSGELYSALSESASWLKLDHVRVAGRQQPVEIYGLAPSTPGVSDLYAMAFSLYERADFLGAALLIQDLDYSPAKALTLRCHELKAELPTTWEGIYSLGK
jgi:adenylate cyclase